MLEEALDRAVAGSGKRRRRTTRREAIVGSLVEQSATGDLRATKLLLDLVLKTGIALFPNEEDEGEDPREYLKRALARIAARTAAAQAKAGGGEGAGGAEVGAGEASAGDA